MQHALRQDCATASRAGASPDPLANHLRGFQPGAGALSLIWTFAGYSIFAGVLLIMLTFRVRKFKRPA